MAHISSMVGVGVAALAMDDTDRHRPIVRPVINFFITYIPFSGVIQSWRKDDIGNHSHTQQQMRIILI
jgi:hypothetical protein